MAQVPKRRQRQAELTARQAMDGPRPRRSGTRDRVGGAPYATQASRSAQRERWRPSVLSLAVTATVVLGLVIVVHAVASSSGSAPTGTNGTSGSAAGVPASAAAPGQVAPAFTLTTLTGAPFSLASAHGHPVVLYFMATTCSTCVQGSRDLAQAMQAAHVIGAQAVAIDVNTGDARSDLASFVQATGVPANAPIVWGVDPHDRIAQAYGIQTLETTIVIDAQGHIAYENPGAVPPQQLAQLVQKAA